MRWLAALVVVGAVGYVFLRRRGSGGGEDGKPFTCPEGMTVVQDHRGGGAPQWSCADASADSSIPGNRPGVAGVPAGWGSEIGSGTHVPEGGAPGYVWVSEPPPGHWVRGTEVPPSTSAPLVSIEAYPPPPPGKGSR